MRFDIAADRVDPGYPMPIAGNWTGMAEAGFGNNIDAAVELGAPGAIPWYGAWETTEVAIDPLALLLPDGIYVNLTLPDPPPEEVLLGRLRQRVHTMTIDERRHALARVRSLSAEATVVERELSQLHGRAGDQSA